MRISDWRSDVCSSDLPFLESHAVDVQYIVVGILEPDASEAVALVHAAVYVHAQYGILLQGHALCAQGFGDGLDVIPAGPGHGVACARSDALDRKSTRLNSSH